MLANVYHMHSVILLTTTTHTTCVYYGCIVRISWYNIQQLCIKYRSCMYVSNVQQDITPCNTAYNISLLQIFHTYSRVLLPVIPDPTYDLYEHDIHTGGYYVLQIGCKIPLSQMYYMYSWRKYTPCTYIIRYMYCTAGYRGSHGR